MALTFGTLLSSQGSTALRSRSLDRSRGNPLNLSGPVLGGQTSRFSLRARHSQRGTAQPAGPSGGGPRTVLARPVERSCWCVRCSGGVDELRTPSGLPSNERTRSRSHLRRRPGRSRTSRARRPRSSGDRPDQDTCGPLTSTRDDEPGATCPIVRRARRRGRCACPCGGPGNDRAASRHRTGRLPRRSP